MIRTRTTAATLSLASLAAFGSTTAATAQRETAVTFGVYATDKPSTVYRQFAAVTEPLSKGLAAKLGKAAKIKLMVFMSYEAALTALVKGKVDMARFGPASYVLAKSRDPKIELLAMESKNGETTFNGMIVVRSDSDIKSVADLRGKAFAFGDRNSTIGRYLAQEQLLKAGISARMLASHDFLQRHDRVFRAVQRRTHIAGALKSGTFKKMNKRKQLRALVEFKVPTKPWVLRSGVPKELSHALRAALLGLEDEKALKSLKITEFVAATDKSYADVRASMKTALQFDGVAKPKPGQPKPGQPKPGQPSKPSK